MASVWLMQPDGANYHTLVSCGLHERLWSSDRYENAEQIFWLFYVIYYFSRCINVQLLFSLFLLTSYLSYVYWSIWMQQKRFILCYLNVRFKQFISLAYSSHYFVFGMVDCLWKLKKLMVRSSMSLAVVASSRWMNGKHEIVLSMITKVSHASDFVH
jgi:hypothetical protein